MMGRGRPRRNIDKILKIHEIRPSEIHVISRTYRTEIDSLMNQLYKVLELAEEKPDYDEDMGDFYDFALDVVTVAQRIKEYQLRIIPWLREIAASEDSTLSWAFEVATNLFSYAKRILIGKDFVQDSEMLEIQRQYLACSRMV
jgi:hypothetical protein